MSAPPPPPGQTPPPWYEPPPPPLGRADRPGGLGTRLLAKLIDGALVTVALSVVSATLGLAAFHMGMRSGSGANLLGALISAAIGIGYCALMESTRGQTIGKMALRLRVENLAGQSPTAGQALRRNAYLAAPLVGLLPLSGTIVAVVTFLVVLGYIALTIHDDREFRRGWHDRFGDTRVVTTS